MESSPEYYNNLIARYFSGEATPEEIREISAWVKENEENKLLFKQYKSAWELTEKQFIDQNLDAGLEWDAFRQKLQPAEQKEEPRVIHLRRPGENGTKTGRMWMRMAAAVVFLLVSASILFYFYRNLSGTVLTAEAGITSHTLPDGSVITQNQGSELSFSGDFVKHRKVTLKGEAYFEVAHDKLHPFVVAGDNARIEVLGTKFNVNTKTAQGNMNVVLTEGRISLYFSDRKADQVILSPGEQAEISASDHRIIRSGKPDMNYMAWKTRMIVFEDVPLKDIARTLASVYHVDIRLSDQNLGNCRITATFDHQPVTAVLNVLKNTLDLQVRMQDGSFILSGKPCN